MYDVTIIGPAVIDILAAPFSVDAFLRGERDVEQIRMSFGGDALNESAVLSRLGKKVQLISKVGGDDAGKRILHYMEENGIDTDGVCVQEDIATAVNIALVREDGNRGFLMDPHSSLRKLGLEDVLPHLERGDMADIVCFASMFISPLFTVRKMEELFAALKAAGKTLVVDMTRPKHGETIEDLRKLFPYMDVFVPNDEEICMLTGNQDPADNVRFLVDAGVRTAIVKTGGDGCLVGTADGIVHVPAVPGIHCVDTTGAGDTFAAGVLAGMCEGRALPDCARLGCAAASCSIEQVGATDGVRSLAQVMERYAQVGQGESLQ